MQPNGWHKACEQFKLNKSLQEKNRKKEHSHPQAETKQAPGPAQILSIAAQEKQTNENRGRRTKGEEKRTEIRHRIAIQAATMCNSPAGAAAASSKVTTSYALSSASSARTSWLFSACPDLCAT